MDCVYIIALTVCAIKVFPLAWRFPWFFASVLASIAFELAYRPFDRAWMATWYPWLIAPLLLLRMAAVAEIVWLHSARFRRRRLLLSSCAFFASLFALIVIVYSPLTLLHLRRALIVGLTGGLAAYILLRWSIGEWPSSFVGRHALFMLLLCASFALPSLLAAARPGAWWTLDTTFYAFRSLLYLTWNQFVFPMPRRAGRSTLRPA